MKPLLVAMMCLEALLPAVGSGDQGDADPFAIDEDTGAEKEWVRKFGPIPKDTALIPNEDGSVSIQSYPEAKLDLAFLKGKAIRVRKIEIFGNMPMLADGKSFDLSGLAGLRIDSAWIYKIPVKDLTPLKGSGLRNLSVTGCPVADLSPLAGLPLTELSLWQTEVSDLSPLKGMRLRNLNIDVNEFSRIRNLTPLAGMKLETLVFNANGVTKGIEIVRGMKSLGSINETPPDDFWKVYDEQREVREKVIQSGLAFSTLTVDADGTCALWINGKELNDLSPIKGLPVTALFISETALKDLSPLGETGLESLHIWRSRIEDLSPLAGMKLKRISIDSDRLADLSPLRGMKLEEAGIRSPLVVDLSVLKGMPLKDLDFQGCGVTDLGFIEGMPLEFIHFDTGRITQGREILRTIKTLKQINREDVDAYFGKDDPARTDPFVK